MIEVPEKLMIGGDKNISSDGILFVYNVLIYTFRICYCYWKSWYMTNEAKNKSYY